MSLLLLYEVSFDVRFEDHDLTSAPARGRSFESWRQPGRQPEAVRLTETRVSPMLTQQPRLTTRTR